MPNESKDRKVRDCACRGYMTGHLLGGAVKHGRASCEESAPDDQRPGECSEPITPSEPK